MRQGIFCRKKSTKWVRIITIDFAIFARRLSSQGTKGTNISITVPDGLKEVKRGIADSNRSTRSDGRGAVAGDSTFPGGKGKGMTILPPLLGGTAVFLEALS